MANLNVNDFKSRLKGGGARPNLFKVDLSFPAGVAGRPDPELVSFMVKGAALPASVITEIAVPFRGRQLKIAGDRTFETWTITVINDTDFAIRDSMEQWMNLINNHEQNTGATDPDAYFSDLFVSQLDKDGEVIKAYDFRGCFPTNLSAIELSYDTENSIEEFTVEFQVQYWESNTTS